jgi:hypothetical protein
LTGPTLRLCASHSRKDRFALSRASSRESIERPLNSSISAMSFRDFRGDHDIPDLVHWEISIFTHLYPDSCPGNPMEEDSTLHYADRIVA